MRREIRQPKKVWRAKLAIARAAAPRQFNKTQHTRFVDAGADSVPVDSVLLEVAERNRQLGVIPTTVARKLNLDPIEDASARQTERPHRWRPQHRDSARRKLADDLVCG